MYSLKIGSSGGKWFIHLLNQEDGKTAHKTLRDAIDAAIATQEELSHDR